MPNLTSSVGRRERHSIFSALLGALALALPCAAQAGLFTHHPKAVAVSINDKAIAEIQRDIDEQRYVDAARQLDKFALAGVKDERLSLLSGSLNLAEGYPDGALKQFKLAESSLETRGAAFTGEGIALSLLSRSNEAFLMLQKAVEEDPSSWRAWNALGSEYDARGDWTQAEAAYDHAMIDSVSAPIVLNNRGYSRLMQRRLDEAVDDFVEALKKRPDLSAARTNLRLAMAMRGDYGRATAGGAADDQAALLNNAGFAAILRGDYARAQDLLGQALKAKSEYYAKASSNLDLAHDLTARTAAGDSVHH